MLDNLWAWLYFVYLFAIRIPSPCMDSKTITDAHIFLEILVAKKNFAIMTISLEILHHTVLFLWFVVNLNFVIRIFVFFQWPLQHKECSLYWVKIKMTKILTNRIHCFPKWRNFCAMKMGQWNGKKPPGKYSDPSLNSPKI